MSGTFESSWKSTESPMLAVFASFSPSLSIIFFVIAGTSSFASIVTEAEAITLENVFAVLMDREALGYSVVKTTVKPAPYNARADYRNFFMKDYHKSFMDLTEKGVVFVIADESGNEGGDEGGVEGGDSPVS